MKLRKTFLAVLRQPNFSVVKQWKPIFQTSADFVFPHDSCRLFGLIENVKFPLGAYTCFVKLLGFSWCSDPEH